ncbi:MAG TPA: CCA tRNA nucleotidyltransferase [Nitrososphaeraceae archaeon]|nr:CCA tRNA nucleotidyltransferase [Nitrososphaeraceae archaeon]
MRNNIIENRFDAKNIDLEIDKIADKVLKLIKPSFKDLEILKSIEKKIKDEIYSYKIPQIVDVKTGGSFAKDTNLKRDMDIDIFILIDRNTNERDFEKLALNVGFKCLKEYHPITRYSEHPYVEGFVSLNNNNREHVRINLVPCYNVEKGLWKSSADRSQFHTEYMKKNLTSDQKNQIRILKAFLKGIGIYGAELSIAGFSGYVTEVLVLKYGNFKNVIKNIATMKNKGEVIAIDNTNNNNLKFQSPIIIIDPVDSNRNLGTAISSESLSRFIFGARALLKNPSLEFFNINSYKKRISLDKNLQKVSQLLPYILVLEFKFKIRSSDIIWGQLKKLTKSFAQRLNDKEFVTIKSECYIYNTNSAILLFFLKFITLSPFLQKKGPSIFMEKEVFQFVKKNKETSSIIWIQDDMSLMCLKKREDINAVKFLDRSIKLEKRNLGIPKGLIADLDNGFKIYKVNKNRLKNIHTQKIIHDFIFKDMILFESAD